MKQQTAMQLLFAEFKSLSETARFSGDEQTANLIDFLCEREPMALKKEEEQIINAFAEGHARFTECGEFELEEKANQYFNQTYRDDTSE